MIHVKSANIIFEKLFDSPVIIRIMKDNPSITEEKIKELYRTQWKEVGQFIRQKKGFNFDVVGFGHFVYNYFPIPIYTYYKEAWIELTLAKRPWPPEKQEYYERSIRTLIENINRNNAILKEMYEKHPQYKEKFKTYWTNVLLYNKQGFFKQNLRYFRRFLEKFDVCISDEIFERTYQNAKNDLRFLHVPTLSNRF
jgi:hypothetical protein